MPKSKHRKNHSVKLKARKQKIDIAKKQYSKYIQARMAEIQEQIKNKAQSAQPDTDSESEIAPESEAAAA